MSSPLHIVILAAGQGTRMKSLTPKVLHEVGGRPMLGRVLDAARELGPAAIHVVHGHGAEAVRAAFATEPLTWALQAEQKGTAHAVRQAMAAVPDAATVLVLYGDVPLIRAATLAPLAQAGAKTLALLTATLADPSGYGRIVRTGKAVQRIVEDKDASPAQKQIREINTGFLAAPAKRLKAWLAKVRDNNAKREFYLTDIVALAKKDRQAIATFAADEGEILGVNDRAQLAQVERHWQLRQAQALMKAGLTLRDPSRFDLRGRLTHGRDCVVDVGVVMEGVVELGEGVVIGPNVVLRNVRLGDATRVEAQSVLESAVAGKHCRIGPFARIRPDSVLGDEAHVGNFVEVKKSTLARGAKANHLAYVGDARVGERANISAGVITCNYDGANKHETVIGDDAFIGSDTQLVAPVSIGAGATIGAGSTITKDVPPGGLTLCRARGQHSIPGWKRPRKPG